MKKNKSFLRRSGLKESMELQITSMADIFTIILVFLLKSFSTGVSSITPSETLLLPTAQAKDKLEDSTKIEISPNQVIFDGKPVSQLHNFKFEKADLEADGTSRSLNIALIQEKKKRLQEGKVKSQQNNLILILADKHTPFSTLKPILTSAGNSGVGDFKLVVVNDD